MGLPNKTFIIFGMGRSGTSLIAQALHKYGVHMGDRLLGAGRGNPLGHYEDMDFLDLNNKILRATGGSPEWLPSKEDVDNFKDLDSEAESLVKSKDNKQLWGWKDPRTTATIDKYIQHLEDPILICSFRNPEMVAKSLNARDGIPIEVALEITKNYNRMVLKYLEDNYTWNMQ